MATHRSTEDCTAKKEITNSDKLKKPFDGQFASRRSENCRLEDQWRAIR